METKANFVVIGAATVLGVLGALGLLVWFAKLEIDRQYTQYEILFESVAGLGNAADVRYNGLPVGKVIDMALDEDDPAQVRVRIELDADTPIKTDTVAQLSSQGVTGVAIVSLSGGSPDAPFLMETVEPYEVPVIPSQRSAVQALTEDAPDLVAEAVEALKELRTFIGKDNQTAVANLLQNLEQASGQLDQALSDFSDISTTVREGTEEISRFTGRLDEIGGTIQTTLQRVNETLDVAKTTIAGFDTTLESATAAFDTTEETIGNIDALARERVPPVIDDLTAAIRAIETATVDVQAQLGAVMDKFGGFADLGTRRLSELEATIVTLDATMAEANASFAAIESASVSFQDLVDGDGAALVTDARTTLAQVQETITGLDQTFRDDVPAIVSDIRAAVTTASEVIDTAARDLSGFTGRLEPLAISSDEAMQAATRTLENADRTLANLDRAIEATETTLSAAERSFTGAEAIINEDLAPAISDVRTAAGQFEETMAVLSEDIPAVTADLRDAVARALNVIEEIETTVASSAAPIRDFSQTGLPEFTKFARQAQLLVQRLEQLARRMERDPARFFFGNNVPDFRR